MAYQKTLQVNYHQQDEGYYCGAASAQMVLDSIGTGLLGQNGLYADNHNHSRDESHLLDALGRPIVWATAPDGLEWTLDDREPGGYIFVTYSLNNEDAISRKIAWTIEHYDVAPCALVLGAKHWIVVRGMDLSKAPTNSTDNTYTINSFRINDPWPPVPSSAYWIQPGQPPPPPPPPPPHNIGDGCGTGGNRGLTNQLVTYTQWKNTYMTGANYHPQGYWQNKFIAVCDPDPPAVVRGPSISRSRLFDGDRLLNQEQVLRLTEEQIQRNEFLGDEVWLDSLRNASPATPILIQRLDRFDDYYYFVPLVSEKGAAVAALAFDGRFGDFQQVISFTEPEHRIVNLPTSDTIMQEVVDKEFELGNYQGYFRVREDVSTILETWVWKPCLESLSPFWPFKMVISGSNKIYVRIDGQVFTKLTDGIYGI